MTEYTLFPIRKNDVNWPLYLMVTGFLKYRYGINAIPFNDMYESLRDDKKKEARQFLYFFVFPSEDLTLDYTEDILDQEAIILKYYFPIDWSDSYPWLDDDDDSMIEIVPMEFFYQEDGQNPEFQHAQTEIPSKVPVIRYNGDSFMEALFGVLFFLNERKLTKTPWYERLQTVKRMFDDEANELHILHNAGLFDHATLWSWLKDQGVSQEDVDTIKAPYVSELKKYAMFVLNELNWNFGTSVREHEREERKHLFAPFEPEQLEKNEAERNRRLQMMSERQQQGRPPKKPTKKPKPAPQNKPQGNTQTQTKAGGSSQVHAKPQPEASASTKFATGCAELLDFGKQVLEGILERLGTGEGASTDKSIAPDKKLLLRNAFIMIVVAILSIALYIVIGPMIGIDADKAGEIHWGLGVIVLMVAMRMLGISKGYKHHHSFRFRCFRLVLGVALAFLFYYTGLWFMQAIWCLMPPTQTYIIIQSIGVTSIVLATINRHCVPNERSARAYSIWIITAVAALIGNFLAVVRAYA